MGGRGRAGWKGKGGGRYRGRWGTMEGDGRARGGE